MAEQNGLPNARTHVNWQLFQEALKVPVPNSKFDAAGMKNWTEKASCLNEIEALGRIACRDCGGLGHSYRYCLTRSKLSLLQKRSRIAHDIVGVARKKCDATLSARWRITIQNGEVCSWLPNLRKRYGQHKKVLVRKVGTGSLALKKLVVAPMDVG